MDRIALQLDTLSSGNNSFLPSTIANYSFALLPSIHTANLVPSCIKHSTVHQAHTTLTMLINDIALASVTQLPNTCLNKTFTLQPRLLYYRRLTNNGNQTSQMLASIIPLTGSLVHTTLNSQVNGLNKSSPSTLRSLSVSTSTMPYVVSVLPTRPPQLLPYQTLSLVIPITHPCPRATGTVDYTPALHGHIHNGHWVIYPLPIRK